MKNRKSFYNKRSKIEEKKMLERKESRENLELIAWGMNILGGILGGSEKPIKKISMFVEK